MPTRIVTLSGEHDRFIQERVVAGRFDNETEAVREALILLEREERLLEARRAARVAELGPIRAVLNARSCRR